MTTAKPAPARKPRARESAPKQRKGSLRPVGRADGDWDICLKGGNGEILMRSVQGYTRKADANRAIAEAKRIVMEDL